MMRTACLGLILAFLVVFTACGGGGGGGGGSAAVALPTSDLVSEPAQLDLGEVPPGGQTTIDFTIRNPTANTTITIGEIQIPPGGDFTLGGPALPLVLGPGAAASFSLTYDATASGVLDAALSVITSSPAGILNIPVSVENSGEIVVDFGTVGLSGGVTPWLDVTLPANAISLTVEGLQGPGDVLDLFDLIGPGGKVYLSGGLGPFVPRSGQEVVTTLIPNTDRADAQLVPGGGLYQFRLVGTAPTMEVRAVVETRADPADESGRLDLNVWLTEGLTVDAASAATDGRLQLALSEFDRVLSRVGVRVGSIDYYDVTDPIYNSVTSSEFSGLLRLTAAAAEVRLNLFFVEEALEPGVGGVSATISGPCRNGTRASGIMVAYEGFPILPARWVGDIAGHETGHYLGLYHTAEENGTHDFMDDTPDCGVLGCAPPGNLMHWQYRGPTNTILSEGQGRVMRGHPKVDPLAP